MDNTTIEKFTDYRSQNPYWGVFLSVLQEYPADQPNYEIELNKTWFNHPLKPDEHELIDLYNSLTPEEREILARQVEKRVAEFPAVIE